MMRFEKIDNVTALMRSRGVMKEAQVYSRKGLLYAKHGAGLIKLLSKGNTTVPSISWIDVSLGDTEIAVSESFGGVELPNLPVAEAAE